MQDIAIQPTMRMIWEAMKLFRVPMTHEYIQNLTEFDLQFIEMSTALDNPRLREKILNTVYDEDYDDYEKESEEDSLTEEERAIMEEIMSKQGVHNNETAEDSFIPLGEDKPIDEDPDDWEEVE